VDTSEVVIIAEAGVDHVSERQALALWLDVTSRAVRAEGPDLTARQTAILLTVYLETGQHTVRGLAKGLGVGKPAIVRAIDALSDANLVIRVADPQDRRNIFIEGTAHGAQQLSDYARNIARHITNITRRPDTSDISKAPQPVRASA
jgi:DNA-binding MarR family transcriptional regulator